MKIEIMDTTLRDGEQTPRIAFSDTEKLSVAKMLIEDVNIDRIEIASARVSKGELLAVNKIISWCKKNNFIERIEVLGFVDKKSIDWIYDSGAKVVNLLTKGSLNHVNNQLGKTPKEHINDIKNIIAYAKEKSLKINLYLEDWSNGMLNSKDYVMDFMNALKNEPVERFMLPDTLGILNPIQTYDFCKTMNSEFPDIRFDFHAHNDYDLAVANTFMAIKAGISGVHSTVNGLGERTGNAPLSSIVGVINDFCNEYKIQVKEKALLNVSKRVETFTGIRIPPNKPIIGDFVFTQTCGVHADGDKKNNLYHNNLAPERFGRLRKYALGKTSGKASISKNLEELGIFLDNNEISKVTKKVVELGDKKKTITTEDLPFIVADILGTKQVDEKIKLINYYVVNSKNLFPTATVKIEINKNEYEATATGDGQYDAFMKALESIYAKLDKKLPTLVDYTVTIPPGGKTNALVETIITWKNGNEFETRGLDPDQTNSAIKSTFKMLNIMENSKN